MEFELVGQRWDDERRQENVTTMAYYAVSRSWGKGMAGATVPGCSPCSVRPRSLRGTYSQKPATQARLKVDAMAALEPLVGYPSTQRCFEMKPRAE